MPQKSVQKSRKKMSLRQTLASKTLEKRPILLGNFYPYSIVGGKDKYWGDIKYTIHGQRMTKSALCRKWLFHANKIIK